MAVSKDRSLPLARREEILRVAAEVFRDKGYQRATTKDIAERMGFTHAAIYYWFKNKQELLTEILDQAARQLLDTLNDTLAIEASPREKLRRVLHTQVSLMVDNQDIGRVFINEKSSLSDENRLRIEAEELEYVQGIAAVIEEGIAYGEFVEQPPVVAAWLVMGMVNSATTWYDPASDLSPEMLADLVCGLAIGGLESGYAPTTPPRKKGRLSHGRR